MSDFKAKLHQIVYRLRLRPIPRWGSLAYSATQNPSWILWSLSLREREVKEWEEMKGGDPLLSRYTPNTTF